MLFYFFIRKSNNFLQQLWETVKGPGNLHNLIRSLILQVILVWKHFNFLVCPHAYILYVSCEIQKSLQHVVEKVFYDIIFNGHKILNRVYLMKLLYYIPT